MCVCVCVCVKGGNKQEISLHSLDYSWGNFLKQFNASLSFNKLFLRADNQERSSAAGSLRHEPNGRSHKRVSEVFQGRKACDPYYKAAAVSAAAAGVALVWMYCSQQGEEWGERGGVDESWRVEVERKREDERKVGRDKLENIYSFFSKAHGESPERQAGQAD
ncbi:hypothetical protein INR49_012114, partial [Caranx melampygus]